MPRPADAPKRLDFLDVARGVAAVTIVVEHGLHQCVAGYGAPSPYYVVAGQAAILVFFMVSGFVIPLSLEAKKSLRDFWRQRVFRLFPVYWFSIALALGYLCLGGPLPLAVPLRDVGTWCANLVLLQSPFGRPHVWGVFWSLNFEVAFYVVCCALFASGLLQRAGPKAFAGLMVVFTLAVGAKLLRTRNPTDDLYNWMIGLSAFFGIVVNRYVQERIGRRTFYTLLAFLPVVLLSIWTLNHRLYPTVATYTQLFRAAGSGLIGYGGFILLLEARTRPMPAFLAWLGRRSYPIYLLHPLVLLLLIPAHWPAGVFMPALLAATLLLADLTHRFVERPGIALGRRFVVHSKSDAAPSASSLPVRRAA